VIENLIAPATIESLSEPARRPGQDQLLRVGFFGNISRLKGIDVLLEAARQLEQAKVEEIVIEIHGEYRLQPPEFQEAFLARLAEAGSNVQHIGPYDETRVDHLMQQVDVVVVPSVWWENSPVVIQEARRNNRPIICSDIGGMAEKVRDGIDGWHFPVGNARALALLLRELAVSLRAPDAADIQNHLEPSCPAPATPSAVRSTAVVEAETVPSEQQKLISHLHVFKVVWRGVV
jgi:glycosyltransferase involved in cell wall biosynthesis